MTKEEKINYFRIATGIVGFGFTHQQMDLIISLYEMILEKKGKGSLDNILAVEYQVRIREEERAIEKLENLPIKEDAPSPPPSLNPRENTLVSYRKYQGSNKKSYVFSKPKSVLGIEEIANTLSEMVGVDQVYKWWYGNINQEPEFPEGEVIAKIGKHLHFRMSLGDYPEKISGFDSTTTESQVVDYFETHCGGVYKWWWGDKEDEPKGENKPS